MQMNYAFVITERTHEGFLIFSSVKDFIRSWRSKIQKSVMILTFKLGKQANKHDLQNQYMYAVKCRPLLYGVSLVCL
jgi:hypothetical protein